MESVDWRAPDVLMYILHVQRDTSESAIATIFGGCGKHTIPEIYAALRWR